MPTPQFDVVGARNAGYSDDEIMSHLSQSGKFDVRGAVAAGYQPSDILNHVAVSSAVRNTPVHMNIPDLAPPSFSERIGDRIRQAAYMIPNALSGVGADYSTGLTTPAAKAEAAKDVSAATASRREMVFGDSGASLPRKIANTVAIGPRMIASQAKDYYQHPENLIGDAVLAAPALAEVKLPGSAAAGKVGGRNIPPPPAATESPLSPEQAKYTAALDKANAPYVKSLQKAEISRQQNILADEGRQLARQVQESARERLNARWDAKREAVGGPDAPTPVRGVVDEILAAEKEELRGLPQTIKQFRDFLKQAGGNQFAEDDAGNLTVPPNATTPWQTLRQFSSNLGAMTGDLPANIYRAVKRVREAADNAIGTMPGGEDYRTLKADEHQYRKDFEDMGPVATGQGNPAARVVRAPTSSFALPHMIGKGADLLVDALNRWDPTGEAAKKVQELREFTDKSKVPQLKEVPPPVVEPPTVKAGPLLKHGLRIGGKISGGIVGSAVGHPLYGIVAGGEAGGALADQIARRRAGIATPPPPKP